MDMEKHNKWVLGQINVLFEGSCFKLVKESKEGYKGEYSVKFYLKAESGEYVSHCFGGDISEITCFCSGLYTFAEKHRHTKFFKKEKEV